jgi:hypothetical protein
MSFFIVPQVGTGTKGDPIRPAYVPALGVNYSSVSFGGSCIVWADATPAQESVVTANADALLVPPLDNSVGAALSTVQATLEGKNIPAQWITSVMTYRTVLRVIVGFAVFIQRLGGPSFGQAINLAGGNLDNTIGSFSAAVRNNLAAAAVSLNLDISAVTGTTTLREALRIIGQQFAAASAVALGDL